jgi:hypothetical protein
MLAEMLSAYDNEIKYKKRKSGDEADLFGSENINPFINTELSNQNNSPKRNKIGQGPCVHEGHSPPRSALKSQDSGKNIEEKRRQSGLTPPSRSALRNTPVKSPGFSDLLSQAANTINLGFSKSPNVGSKLQRPSAGRRITMKGSIIEQIKNHFDRAFTINEEKVNDLILSRLKPKNKWDFKDKSQKQQAVIDDLKEAFLVTFQEIKNLKEKCISTERILNDTIITGQKELDDYIQLRSAMRLNETQLKKELMRVKNELTKVSSQLSQSIKYEKSLKSALNENEIEKSQLKEKFAAEQALRYRAEIELESFRKEIENIKKEASENSKLIVLQCDQVFKKTSYLYMKYCFIHIIVET